MKKVFDIFRIKGEEKWSAIIALFVAIVLNALTIIKYNNQFSQLSENYHKLFVKAFHVAGFDPLTYAAVSQWNTEYNVYRHPLLAFFMYIPNQINQGLMMLTGYNCVQYIVGAILVFCAFYSFIFLYRIFREVIGTERWDANLLSAFYFSFAYVMVSAMVPDHFIMSMMILLTTLYITGVCIKKGRKLTIWQTVLLFLFTAGVSLNNGLKTYLAALFTNGKHFFHIKYFLLGVILPSAVIWGFARWEYRTFVWPKEMARKEIKMKKDKEAREKLMQQYKDTAQVKDSADVAIAVKKIVKQKARDKYVRDHKQIWNKNKGKPIAKGEFSSWTDISTSRSETMVENFFGEAIMLHQDHLLGDVLRDRPVIVKYKLPVNYVVEGIIVILFILGLFAGRKSRFLWLTMMFFLFDFALHIGLGFGINEVYIMTAHYMYALPIAIGFLVEKAGTRYQAEVEKDGYLSGKRRSGNWQTWGLRGLLLALTLYLWISNGYLLVNYMIG